MRIIIAGKFSNCFSLDAMSGYFQQMAMIREIDLTLAQELLPKRRRDGDKWSHGVALLVAGSRGLCGAAAFAARAAYRVGCGYLRLALPNGVVEPVQQLAPEAVLLPMGKRDADFLDGSAVRSILGEAKRVQGWAIGPGLSRHHETQWMVRELMPLMGGRGVIDADGLNALAGHLSLLKESEAELILTPHAGEWERLFGEPLAEGGEQRAEQVSTTAAQWGVTLIAKGATTWVGEPSGGVWRYKGECSALAKAGSGDLLTGAILGFLVQGASVADAARLGVWVHGRAGQIGGEQMTDYSLLPSELAHFFPQAIQELVASGQ